MPVFGIEGGVSAVIGPREIGDINRQMERERTTAPEELEAISELSEETKVYIYSVGAWPQQVSMGSLGTKWIPGLAEEKCLIHGDLSVSEPLIITGVPSEPYPGDGEGRRIYHKPQKHDPNRRHTGYHLALEIIGAADKSNKSNDLRPFGLFVSKQPEQSPDSPTFPQWKADVQKAQKAFSQKCAEMCGKATQAWKAGTFQREFLDQNSPGSDENRIFLVARVTKRTKAECPFLENTSASVENKECIAGCGRILPIGSLKCLCGVIQVTELIYEREIKRRQEEASEEDGGVKRRGPRSKPN